MTFQIEDLSYFSRRHPSLSGIRMELKAGEAHALLGGDASGKSLLCRLIAGYCPSIHGRMTLHGEPFAPRDPREALEKGVHLLHAQSQLAPDLTVPQNLFLGREPSRHGWVSPEREEAAAREALAVVEGGDLPFSVPVSRLSRSQQIRVEMARVLLQHPRLVLIDTDLFFENPADFEILSLFVRKLRAAGAMVLITSRTPADVHPLCSRYTLLRDGKMVSQGELKTLLDSPAPPFLEQEPAPSPPAPLRHIGAKVLSTHALSGRNRPRGVTLTLHQGEIFGLFGLPHAGQTSLLKLLFGLHPALEGEIYYRQENITPLPAAERVRRGMAYLPASLEEGIPSLFFDLPLTDNLLLSRLSRLSRWGFFSAKKLELQTLDWMEKLQLFGRHPSLLARDLPLQAQRVLALGRLFHPQLQLLLLDQPTLGMEAPLRSHLYQWFYELALDGKTLLITGSHYRELLKLCDTIGVMRNGVLVAVRPAREWTERELTETALAGRSSLLGNPFMTL